MSTSTKISSAVAQDRNPFNRDEPPIVDADDSSPPSLTTTTTNNNNHNKPKALPALPPIPTPDSASSSPTKTLQVDGASISLDHLGPTVVGRDGTVSRIANWAMLSEFERQNTLRILGKRNQLRLEALRGEGQGKAEEAKWKGIEDPERKPAEEGQNP